MTTSFKRITGFGMKPVRIIPGAQTADLSTFRAKVGGLRGEARCRHRDCTGHRFLVRDEFMDRFQRLAAENGFRVEPDAREPFPIRS